ncbi:hypothetical protein FS749_013590 [Ceratobasidium sp. UAMH 11750]|nr:hypothetical protein FS749_013590 [Ceratobasidium sp. UAMH 11750]
MPHKHAKANDQLSICQTTPRTASCAQSGKYKTPRYVLCCHPPLSAPSFLNPMPCTYCALYNRFGRQLDDHSKCPPCDSFADKQVSLASWAQTRQDLNHLAIVGSNAPVESNDVQSILPQYIYSLEINAPLANPGLMLDTSARMCTRFTTHLFFCLTVSPAAPPLAVTPRPILWVADFLSQTHLNSNASLSSTKHTSQTPSNRVICIAAALADTPWCGFPSRSGFPNHCRSLRFNGKPDYLYLRKLFRMLTICEGCLDESESDTDCMVAEQPWQSIKPPRGRKR